MRAPDLRVRLHLPPDLAPEDLRASVAALAYETGADADIVEKALRPHGERQHAARALKDAEDAIGASMMSACDAFNERVRGILDT